MGNMSKQPTQKQAPLAQRKQDVTTVKPKRNKPGPAPIHDRAAVMLEICETLSMGESLDEACRRIPGGPTAACVLDWVDEDPEGIGTEYARARRRGYLLLGDRISELASETHAFITVQSTDAEGNLVFNPDGSPHLKKVLAPLSADVIASKRLQVDTLKWKLSKMLPKVFGEKISTEHSGPGGGPIITSNLNLKGLSEAELSNLDALLTKAAKAQS